MMIKNEEKQKFRNTTVFYAAIQKSAPYLIKTQRDKSMRKQTILFQNIVYIKPLEH